MSTPQFDTILLDVDTTDHVATITLNRPERLNAFDRTMCTEMREAWRIVKLDDSVHAVVLRAAGDRAFSSGLDIKAAYGQPDNVWNHEDPGELLSPKWQRCGNRWCAPSKGCAPRAPSTSSTNPMWLFAPRTQHFRLACVGRPGLRAGTDRPDAAGRPG